MSQDVKDDSKEDENEDIYKDLGDFHYDDELIKLEERNKAFAEEVKNLSEKLSHTLERNSRLEKMNDILVTNISILLKTAKAEIERKQSTINELRKDLENMKSRNRYRIKEHMEKGFHEEDAAGEELHKEGHESVTNEEHSSINRDFSKDSDKTEHKPGKIDLEKYNNKVGKRKSSSYEVRDHSRSHSKRRSKDESKDKSSNDNTSGYCTRGSSRHSQDTYQTHTRSPREYRRPHSNDRRRRSERRKSNESSRDSKSRSLRSLSPRHSRGSHWTDYKNDKRSDSRRSSPGRTEPRHRRSESSHRKEVSKGTSQKAKAINTNTDTVASNNAENASEGLKENEKKCYDTSKSSQERKESKNSGINQKRGLPVENNSHKESTDLFTRQSVLDGIYNDVCSPKNSNVASREAMDNILKEDNSENDAAKCSNSSGEEEGRELRFGRKSKTEFKPRTLYSRRMEAKFKQQIAIEQRNENRVKACGENAQKRETDGLKEVKGEIDEKEDGEITDDEGGVNCSTKKDENKTEIPGNTSFNNKTEKPDPESKLGSAAEASLKEMLAKKLPEDSVESEAIKEFTPLKNNYKLMEISLTKPFPNQHILDYYNLKPSVHQISVIESDSFDLNCVPVTPGKDLGNSCISMEESEREKCDDKIRIFDEIKTTKKEGQFSNEKNFVNSEEIDNRRTNSGIVVDNLFRTRNLTTPTDDCLTNGSTDASDSDFDKRKKKCEDSEITHRMRTRSCTKSDCEKRGQVVAEPEKKNCDVRKTNGRRTRTEGKRKRKITESEEGEEEEEKKKSDRTEKKKRKCFAEDIQITEMDDRSEECGPVPHSACNSDALRKNVLDDLSLSDSSDCRPTTLSSSMSITGQIVCLETPTKCISTLSNVTTTVIQVPEDVNAAASTVNSDHSSGFKILSSYLMLSANDDSDVDLSENDTGSSDDYSDSGASAFVDLL